LTPQRSRIEPIREERSHRDNPEIRKTQYNRDMYANNFWISASFIWNLVSVSSQAEEVHQFDF